MSPPKDASAPGAGISEGGNGDQAGGQDHVQCTALPRRPKLSDNAERLLGQLKPAGFRQVVPPVEPRPARFGDVQVTGELVLRLAKNAMPWEIRRAFSVLANLPDGVTVVVKLPRRARVVDLTDALGGLDNLPNVTIVVKGSAHQFRRVAEAVAALRASAARRAAGLRQVAS